MLIAESGSRRGTQKSRFAGVRESQDSMGDRKAAGFRTCHCSRGIAGDLITKSRDRSAWVTRSCDRSACAALPRSARMSARSGSRARFA
jgi:hypothetical protein